ncbi:Oidioi.mRNA.OKI2018_I69.PAR.g10467.t1.cds [Oikopleura dioica]|uniref:Oidioi.mRNA.OKI2018_I69.PAR.g10467.t1.cds n=1 Tax=Oikopleura dioica TaxID=34765 RepID=A0ABN7RQR3_OIKDI|nr:Oidioi.mRNA.OKI2018_I69.PAR.g10467.t1.cds [Oikopleura dioica]
MKVLSSLLASSLADIYLHFPRGSNNRLNEQGGNRENGNRLFDSQNGGGGGYNVGDLTSEAATTVEGQSKATYFQSGEEAPTELAIEWFSQHGCGLANKNDANWINCQIVIQYMCQDSGSTRMSNGFVTTSSQYTEPAADEDHDATLARKDTDFEEVPDTGFHESWESYDACYRRERNRGLFMADKNPGRSKGATRTRQNANGNKRGLECPEERDYYPYWHPSEWTDIAVLTSEPTKCENMVANSGNRVVKHECVHFIDENTVQGWSEANHKEACDMAEGTWIGFQSYKDIIGEDQLECEKQMIKNKDVRWAVPYLTGPGRYQAPKEKCLVLHPEPECITAPNMRTNHNGNTDEGTLPNFKWTLPHYEAPEFTKECALRIRYNITTNDYPDDFSTDQTETYYSSPEIWANPVISYKGIDLALAINTAQFGRVFQDRTHLFQIVPRPASIPDDHKIFNVGVRGRRGNAAQTYPAIEYDFSPTDLEINSYDLVHFQWEGSNTSPTGAGQGQENTDRSNIVPLVKPNTNIPAGWIEDQNQNDDLPVDHFSFEENGVRRTFYVRPTYGYNMLEVKNACNSFDMELPMPTSDAYNEALNKYWFNPEGVWKGDFPLGINAKWIESETEEGIVYNHFDGTNPKMDFYNTIYTLAVMKENGKWYNARHEWDYGWFPCVKEVYDVKLPDPEMFSEWLWTSGDVSDLTHMDDLKIQMATGGFYGCHHEGRCSNPAENPVEPMNNLLNNAPAYFKGNVVRMNKGIHQYMCTRNNAFTNRSHKGTIIVH